MSTATHDTKVKDIIESLDRSHFEARNVQLGENSSFSQTQNVHINIPSPSTAQSPDEFYDFPDQLSPYFLGRDDDLKRIRSALEEVEGDYPARCIVYGMPGMGKTQLALKYANTAKEEGWYSYIFWISATSREKFVQGYSGILHQIAHPSRTEPDRDIQCKVAKAWLESQEKKWLILLDNVTKETLAAMREFMPQRNHRGHTVCTARTVELAGEIAEAHAQQYKCLELAKLTTTDAIQLLTSKLDTNLDELDKSSLEAANQVVTSVECLPLVVSQAAAYMQVSQQSLTQLSNTYKTARPEMLTWVSSDSSYYDGGTLAAVYSAALKKIQDSSPAMMDLLRILVFLDPEGIPTEMLRNGSIKSIDPSAQRETHALLRMSGNIPKRPVIKSLQQRKVLSSSRQVVSTLERKGTSKDLGAVESVQELLRSEVKCHEALQRLQELSIISQRSKNSKANVWLHDLVQEVLFEELLPRMPQREFWLARTIQLIFNARLINAGTLHLSDFDPFAAQATTLKRWLDTHGMHSMMLIDICIFLARDYIQTGHDKQAEGLAIWCLNKLKPFLGPKHPATLKVMLELGGIWTTQGKWVEAEKVLLSTLNIVKNTSGARSELYLWSALYLGALYNDQGRETEAANLYIQCFSDKVVRDPNLDPKLIVECLRRLGIAHFIQERPEDAEQVCLRAMRIATEVVGPKSREAIYCIESLCKHYDEQREDEKSMEMRLQVLVLLEERGESETAAFWQASYNLAMVYHRMGRLKQAQKLLEQVLERSLTLNGADHRDTVICMGGLAETLRDCGQIKDAIAFLERAVRSSEIVYGKDHRWTKEYTELLEQWRIEARKAAEDEQQLDTEE